MKHYELTYLISPELSKEEANSLSTEISSLIQEKQGILEKTTPILKKQLAYPIKKKTTAYLNSFDFQIKAEKLKDMESQIKSNSKILRYLILTKLPFKDKKEGFPAVFKKIKKKKKVELKEIEKKLEEILK